MKLHKQYPTASFLSLGWFYYSLVVYEIWSSLAKPNYKLCPYFLVEFRTVIIKDPNWFWGGIILYVYSPSSSSVCCWLLGEPTNTRHSGGSELFLEHSQQHNAVCNIVPSTVCKYCHRHLMKCCSRKQWDYFKVLDCSPFYYQKYFTRKQIKSNLIYKDL